MPDLLYNQSIFCRSVRNCSVEIFFLRLLFPDPADFFFNQSLSYLVTILHILSQYYKLVIIGTACLAAALRALFAREVEKKAPNPRCAGGSLAREINYAIIFLVTFSTAVLQASHIPPGPYIKYNWFALFFLDAWIKTDSYILCLLPTIQSYYIYMFLMRDEKEERKKQARSNKQTRQSNTAHPTCIVQQIQSNKALALVAT